MTCRDREFLFQKNTSIFEYAGTVQTLIKKYKFGGKRILSGWFARRAAEFFADTPGPFCIVPVPGNPASIRQRGWDQVAEITSVLAVRYRFQVRGLLYRTKSRQQKSLNFAQRCENLRGKIHMAPRGRNAVQGNIILFDDVFTTGATVNECTRVLQSGGDTRGEISVITIAID
jgi:competence protein ComFC